MTAGPESADVLPAIKSGRAPQLIFSLAPGYAAQTSPDRRFVRTPYGVVLDTQTNLEWYSDPESTKYYYQYADRWLSDLCLDGAGGWRLPTIEELKGVVDANHSPVHPSGDSDEAWTSAADAHDITRAGVFSFYTSKGSWNEVDADRKWRILAVRTSEPAPAPGQNATVASRGGGPEVGDSSDDGRFLKGASGVILDTDTGLEWYPSPGDEAYTWDESKRWVKTLDVAGGGWRLPVMDELESFATKEKYAPGGSCHRTPLVGWPSCYSVRSGDDHIISSPVSLVLKDGSEHWSHFGSHRGRIIAVRQAMPDTQKNGVAMLATPWLKSTAKSERAPFMQSGSCASMPDNGRFEVQDSGVIRDTATGLEWYPGLDVDYDWGQARRWATGLRVDGGDWRMPTLRELQGFALNPKDQPLTSLPCLPAAVAGQWLQGSAVWSGQTCGEHAWILPFSSGKATQGDDAPTRHARALAVRLRR